MQGKGIKGAPPANPLFLSALEHEPRYSRRQLRQEASLTALDIDQINQCRRPHNRLGFGYQLGFVRLLNRFPAQQPFELIDELLTFVGVHLAVPDHPLPAPAADHLRAPATYHRIPPAHSLRGDRGKASGGLRLRGIVLPRQTAALEARVQEFLKEQKILQPADSTVARIIGEQRKLAREHIFEKIAAGVPTELAKTLDDFLVVTGDKAISRLQKIKANPSKASAEAMLSLTDKLAAIAASGVLAIDLSWLNNNYQRALFHYVRKSSVDRLRELARPRRNAALVCFLWQSYRHAVDQLVDMYDKLLTRMHTQAQNGIDERMRQQRRTIRTSLVTFRSLGEIILDDSVEDAQLRARLFATVSREELTAQVSDITEWVTGNKTDLFHEVVRRANHLRKFSPAFLARWSSFTSPAVTTHPACGRCRPSES